MYSVFNMDPKFLIAFIVAVAFAQANGACLCSFGEGKDMCHGGTGSSKPCSPLVIRPVELPKFSLKDVLKPRVVCKQINPTGLVKPFNPIGDLCSCKQSIVTPAFVPRPSCASCHHKKLDESTIFSSSHSVHHSGHGSGKATIYVAPGQLEGESDSGCMGVPADPVSLSLAYAAQHKPCTNSEHKLQYGFAVIPKDGSRAKVVKHVIEEGKLHDLAGKIVEMKPYKCERKTNVDDEAYEDLIALQEEAQHETYTHEKPSRPSYQDIGFRAAKLTSGQFRSTHGHGEHIEFDSNDDEQAVEESAPCRDGFIPGNAIIRNIPQKEVYVSGPSAPADCGDEAIPIKYVTYAHHTNERSHHTTHHTSSSSTSGCH